MYVCAESYRWMSKVCVLNAEGEEGCEREIIACACSDTAEQRGSCTGVICPSTCARQVCLGKGV